MATPHFDMAHPTPTSPTPSAAPASPGERASADDAPPPPQPSPAVPHDRRTRLALLTAMTAAFVAMWLWQVRQTEGFLEADAATHYLIARFAFDEPYRFVDIWGRPVKTLLYSLPAVLAGRVGVQFMSLLLALACAAVAYQIARHMGLRHPELAWGFTLAQPLVFLHSFAELTELPFALLLGLTTLAYLERRWRTLAVLAGLLPLARPEGFAFLLLAGVLLAAHRRLRLLPVLLWGLAAWSVAGWHLFGRDGSPLTWLYRHWPYAGESVYTEGGGVLAAAGRLLRFPLSMPAVTGPGVFPGLLVGGAIAAASAWRGSRAAAAVLAVAGAVLIGHSLLYAAGAMASNGELRYLLVVAPFWAVLTAAGWDYAFRRLGRSPGEMLRFAAYAAALPLLVNFRVYGVLPLRFDDDWRTARLLAHWADRYGKAHGYPHLMAAHPGVWYFLDRSNTAPGTYDFTTARLHNPPAGTVLLYDPVYARFNASRDRRVESLDELLAAGWTPLPLARDGRFGGWQVLLSIPLANNTPQP
ncbi:MAG: hypothetical protein ACK4PI_06470 [Tepidisphaerales bacterium]